MTSYDPNYWIYQSTYPSNYVVGDGGYLTSFLDGQAVFTDGAYVETSFLASGAGTLFTQGSGHPYDLRPIQIFGNGYATKVLGTHGYVSDLRVRPWGAFKNFTIFRTNDPDLVGYIEKDDLGRMNNPSPSTGSPSSAGTGPEGAMTSGGWTQHYRVFIPPKRAAYMVAAPTFPSVPAGKNIYIDGNQMEIVQTGNRNPSAFVPARSLTAYANPALLNYCENPNGVVSTRYWTGVTQIANGGGMACSSGTATVSVPHPTPGQSYVVAAVVWGNTNPVTISVSGSPSTLVTNTAPGAVAGQTRVWATYKPLEVETDIVFTSTTSFNVMQVMVTAGTQPVAYFDGDSGSDYMWESGGVANLCRSYWYPNRNKRNGVLTANLLANMPFGMTLNGIMYATLPKPDGDILFGEGYYGGGSYE